MNDFLAHVGTPHEGMIPHSGRHPWGSGENAYQRAVDFYGKYNNYLSRGYSKKEIAERMGIFNKFGKPDIQMLNAQYSIAQAEKRAWEDAEIKRLHDKEGLGWTEIAAKVGMSESTVRSKYKNDGTRLTENQKYENMIKNLVDEYKYLDVSSGEHIALGITKNRFDQLVKSLEAKGYECNTVYIDQMGTNHKTTISVLSPPGTPYSEVSENKYDIRSLDINGKVIDVDGTIAKLGIDKPPSISSDRILVRYNEEGGVEKDGLIELRRGVPDLSLGDSQYAQVRIAVDDSHYLKGMAIYNDHMPPGVDVIFNSNKHLGTDKLDTMKKLKTVSETSKDIDWDNPFGASVTQLHYEDKDGNKIISPVHIVNKEGDWMNWSKNLASQFLSKQPKYMAEQQLKLSYLDKKEELETINSLTNPAVKQKLLESYADKADSLAVELKAHPFPGQQTHVLLPFKSVGDNDIYASKYPEGTQVALIRYPHGGQFEIPILTVRNRNKEVKEAIGNAPDAVGISAKTAQILSGADFDGDTAVIFPLSDKVKVQTKGEEHPAIRDLRNFEPKEEYKGYEGMKPLDNQRKQREMGIVTNLITDMTLQGAPLEHIVRATKHSMVIIDAEKHKLDWKRSFKENKIADLQEIYQKHDDGTHGASTIISRSGSEMDVPERRDFRYSKNSIDPVTGKKIIDGLETGNTYLKARIKNHVKLDDGTEIAVDRVQKDKSTGQNYYIQKDDSGNSKRVYFDQDRLVKGGEQVLNKDKKTGEYYYISTDNSTGKKYRTYVRDEDISGGIAAIKEIGRTQKSTKMAEAQDAYELTSGGSREKYSYPIERVYADYANDMKALANQARLSWLKTKPIEYSKEAKAEYKEEVDSLNRKLKICESKAPMERQAQLIANRNIALRKEANPALSLPENKDQLKKYKAQAINSARKKLGIKKEDYTLEITDKEWKAIQSGALSHSRVKKILDAADLDKVKELATPRRQTNITPTMKSLAKAYANRGFSLAEISDRLGISTSSVYSICNE